MSLFSAYFVADDTRERKKQIYHNIYARDAEAFLKKNPAELAESLISEYAFDVPRLNRDGIQVEESGDAQVDVG